MHLSPGRAKSWLPSMLMLVLALCSHGFVFAQQGTVRSELSAPVITRDESVTLTVQAVGVEGEPDTSALQEDFDILGTSTSRQVSTVTGLNKRLQTTSVLTFTLELMPRKVGVITVPPVTVGTVASEALTLTVNELPVGAARDVFVETSVDKQQPWVQSQVVMTVRVFQAVDIVDGSLSDPTGKDIEIQRLGEDSRHNETREGRQYAVTERRFAVFPQKSGRLMIDPVILSVSVPATPSRSRGFFSPTRKLSRRSDVVELDVQPRPASGASWWLPASAVTIQDEWTGGVGSIEVGQPVTREIVVRAAGVLDSQLPDLTVPVVEGISLYADQPVRQTGMNTQGLVAEQLVKWALIPQKEGKYTLPAVSLDWFNTLTGEFETASLPEVTLQVVPASPGSTAMIDPATGTAGSGIAASDAASSSQSQAAGDAYSAQDESAVSTGTAPTDTAVAVDQGMSSSELPVDVDSEDDAQRSPTAEQLQQNVSPGSVAAIGPVESVVGEEQMASSVGMSSEGTPGAVPAAGLETSGGVSPAIAGDGLTEDDASAGIAASSKLSVMNPSHWRILALAMLGLWILTIVWFLWYRRQSTLKAKRGTGGGPEAAGQPDRMSGLKAAGALLSLEAACRSGDVLAVRDSVLEWARRQWPADSPSTLTSLAARLPQGQARDLLRQLDASVYSRAGNGVGSTVDSFETDSPVRTETGEFAALPALLRTALAGAQGSASTPVTLAQSGRLPTL